MFRYSIQHGFMKFLPGVFLLIFFINHDLENFYINSHSDDYIIYQTT